mmetsp:Transcript_46068/g.147329  ORF Transcript_46068/g.147329 Transcript_46068/m.147329 type:complete len:227 (+) Transcript_46068:2672-3352(+)
MSFTTAASIFSSTIRITTPRSSRPRRPARPLIWMYSPEVTHRKAVPSNLRALVNTQVRAGMLRPIEKVSVAKRTLMNPSWNMISMTSFMIGNSPEWCTPMPRCSSGSMSFTLGSRRSSSDRVSMALVKTPSTSFFSSSLVRSIFSICDARLSHSRLEKEKTMQGSYPRCMIIFTILEMSLSSRSAASRSLPVPLPLAPFFSMLEVSTEMARWKFSARKALFSSTTM